MKKFIKKYYPVKLFKQDQLWDLGITTIQSLEDERGILASGREEIYGCIFGRDSLITSIKLLNVYESTGDPYFLNLVRKVLVNLAQLQGREVNIESGEEPGKCIHEFRPKRHEHLTERSLQPWFVYPDNIMRNYDTVDATQLFLIATYRFWQQSKDEEFLRFMLPYVNRALDWVLIYGDSNCDGFIDYQLHPQRVHGGLVTQSWMDSAESVFHEDGSEITFPIAPVEVQAYTYLALRLWATHYASEGDPFMNARASELASRANKLKIAFNEIFISADENGLHIAAALDGRGRPLNSLRSSIGHCLWASLDAVRDGIEDSIVEDKYIPGLVARITSPDLFEEQGGVRTLSTRSIRFEANSYHNGSIWPHDNSIIAEGLEKFGFREEASRVRRAMLEAIHFFGSPVELYVFDGEYKEYVTPHGQKACRNQAWAAASILNHIRRD